MTRDTELRGSELVEAFFFFLSVYKTVSPTIYYFKLYRYTQPIF